VNVLLPEEVWCPRCGAAPGQLCSRVSIFDIFKSGLWFHKLRVFVRDIVEAGAW